MQNIFWFSITSPLLLFFNDNFYAIVTLATTSLVLPNTTPSLSPPRYKLHSGHGNIGNAVVARTGALLSPLKHALLSTRILILPCAQYITVIMTSPIFTGATRQWNLIDNSGKIQGAELSALTALSYSSSAAHLRDRAPSEQSMIAASPTESLRHSWQGLFTRGNLQTQHSKLQMKWIVADLSLSSVSNLPKNLLSVKNHQYHSPCSRIDTG